MLVAYGAIPYFTQTLKIHPAMAWFFGGMIVFIPLFIASILLVLRDGFRTWNDVFDRLRIHSMTKRDWKYVGGSFLVISIVSAIIMGIAELLHTHFGFPPMEKFPPFMKFEPFDASQRWMLIVWVMMFFFNIVGEELLWRGYILPRQEAAVQHRAWIINAALWMMFHLCFGLSLMIVLLPIMIVLPYAVQETKNTLVGMLIHALLNGPSFIIISLGILQ